MTAQHGAAPADRVRSAVILGAVAALGLLVVAGSFRLGVGSPTSPGAGMWPAIIGALWCLAGTVAAVGAARGAVLPSIRPVGSPLVGVGLVVVFIGLFSYVDLAVAVLAVSLLWMLLLSDMPWPRAIVGSLVITAVIYGVFVFAVGTPLPASLLPTF
ncbi:MAG: tripartite tricarboxylate transporter TctB family protein [Actinomycetaceae bacterium]